MSELDKIRERVEEVKKWHQTPSEDEVEHLLFEDMLELIDIIDTKDKLLTQGREIVDKTQQLAFRYGQIGGGHHRLWVIDQMLRVLLGDKGYADFVTEYESEDDYKWNTGIAP